MDFLDLDDARERLLGRCLRRQAEAIPEADFLVWGETHYSYGRVNELANACARGFRELGVRPGDIVSFLMETCPEYVWTTLALNKLGAVWVPANVGYKGRAIGEKTCVFVRSDKYRSVKTQPSEGIRRRGGRASWGG